MTENFEKEWQLFLTKVDDYANTEFKDWTILTLLSYFLTKYKVVNGLEFIFTDCKKGPTKSKEMRDASKIWRQFDKGRLKNLESKEDKLAYKQQLVEILREYIDWAFDVKFRGRQINVTGLGIFAVANFMNEFLQWRKNSKRFLPRRNDPLPKDFISWLENNAPEIWQKQQLHVLEDLNLLANYIDTYDLEKTSLERLVLEKARSLGIMSVTGRLKFEK